MSFSTTKSACLVFTFNDTVRYGAAALRGSLTAPKHIFDNKFNHRCTDASDKD